MTASLFFWAAGCFWPPRLRIIKLRQFKMSVVSSVVIGRQKRKAAIDANNKLVANNKNAHTEEDLESPQEEKSGHAVTNVLPDVDDKAGQVSHQSCTECNLEEVEPVISDTLNQQSQENTDNLEDQQREVEDIRVDSGIKLTNLIFISIFILVMRIIEKK